jgi:hypothetical protein
MTDSLDTLVARATNSTWVPLLAERFARDRLRALIRLESDAGSLNPSVLFLCVHNAGRSQMAFDAHQRRIDAPIWFYQISQGQYPGELLK